MQGKDGIGHIMDGHVSHGEKPELVDPIRYGSGKWNLQGRY